MKEYLLDVAIVNDTVYKFYGIQDGETGEYEINIQRECLIDGSPNDKAKEGTN